MRIERLTFLYKAYMTGTLSPEEKEELWDLWTDPALEETVHALMDAQYAEKRTGFAIPEQPPASADRIFRDILEFSSPHSTVRHLRWWPAAAAAVLLLAVAFYFFDRSDKPSIAETTGLVQIAPGSSKAMLTLGDGTVVPLDSSGNLPIHSQEARMRQAGGALKYEGAASSAVYHTLTTPRGGQYQVTLPDGTVVWLNAASALHYPTAFTGNERAVQVTGEAYFEVAKDARRPFRVGVHGRMTVEVLGTHFNVQAYDNEKQVQTTLLEGRVKVSAPAGGMLTLAPGQQAVMPNGNEGSLQLEDHPDLAQATAWRNGVFNFEGLRLQAAMRQLERWYDITVVYEPGAPNPVLFGKITRQVPLEGLLDMLKGLGLQFRMEADRKLVIGDRQEP